MTSFRHSVPIVLLTALVGTSCGNSQGHTHAGFEIPAGEAVPTVAVIATEDPLAGWNLQLITTNFAFAPHRAGREIVLGEGHGHLYVDGDKRDRLYGSWYHLADLAPGRHTIKVTLNGNNHAVYQVDGKDIGDTVTIDVIERSHSHDDLPPLEADPAMTASVRAEEDPVSGWNLFIDTAGFSWAPQNAGLGPVPGEGHGHLYVDDQKVGRIYGPAVYLGSLAPGRHSISVGLFGNNHAPYSIAGDLISASVSIEVSGEFAEPDHTVDIEVRDGAVLGGTQQVEVASGQVVELTVTSDAPDTVHLHGYDLTAPIGPTGKGTLTFQAGIQGVFEVELEETGLLILELTVR